MARYLYHRIWESFIDFPQKSLDLSIWQKEGDSYTLRPEVKRHILSVLGRFPNENLLTGTKINIVGSIGTNQYSEDADIDVHISPEQPDLYDEEGQKYIKDWFDSNRDNINGWIGKHPIEVYLQLDPNQDMMSDGVYDIGRDRWLKGPTVKDKDYNPYIDFSHVADDIRSNVKKADELIGELKRDVIDYTIISKAIKKMDPEVKKSTLEFLTTKLDEIEDGIEELYKERRGWSHMRRQSSKPQSLEQAEEDMEMAKNFKDKNALFKFINRYQYMKVIGDLKTLMKDDKLDSTEVDNVKDILGVNYE